MNNSILHCGVVKHNGAGATLFFSWSFAVFALAIWMGFGYSNDRVPAWLGHSNNSDRKYKGPQD